MNFDFYKQYKNYSNTDLLIILQRPDQYHEDAVKISFKLLSERKVSESDIENAKSFYNELDNTTKHKTDKINSYKQKASDLFKPVINATKEVKPEKWLNILLLIIGLQYLWTFYINISDCIKFGRYIIDCKSYGFDNRISGTLSYWTCFLQNDLILLFVFNY